MGLLAASMVMSILLPVALYVIYIIAYWKIFEKAGEAGWKAIIPFYNTYTAFKISWGNGWYFLLLWIPAIVYEIVALSLYASLAVHSLIWDVDFFEDFLWSFLTQMIALLIVGIILVVYEVVINVLYCIKLSQCFGRSGAFAVGLFFLPYIFTLILGFGSSVYRGPYMRQQSGAFSGSGMAKGYSEPPGNASGLSEDNPGLGGNAPALRDDIRKQNSDEPEWGRDFAGSADNPFADGNKESPLAESGVSEDNPFKGAEQQMQRKENIPAAAMGSVRCVKGSITGQGFRIPEGTQVNIGRNPQRAHLVIDNPKISNLHCVISYVASKNVYIVTDYSSNGTFINGIRLQKNQAYEIPAGSLLNLAGEAETFALG